MRIGELSKASGFPVSTIRYYERIGLLAEPERTESGYRAYGPDSIERLRFVQAGQATGLRLNEVAHLADLRERGISTCEHSLALLRSRVGEITTQIQSLDRLRAQLELVIERADALDPAMCTDPMSCQVFTSPG